MSRLLGSHLAAPARPTDHAGTHRVNLTAEIEDAMASTPPGFVTRFAPSPTGYLHLGHAFSALTAFDAAEAAGGRLLLRIEDIDAGRCRPEFEAAIVEDLRWLGVRWTEPVRRQSEHLDAHQAALNRLIAQGLVYRCFLTRRELSTLSAPHGPETAPFFGEALPAALERARLAAGDGFAWRLDVREAVRRAGALAFLDETGPVAAAPEALGDVVLARRDAATSYHLASVVDDAAQGVSHVIRGEDLRQAAHLHRLLQALLGLPTPIYRHHRLILGLDGRRLAKRDGGARLRTLRDAGATPASVRAMLGLAASS